MSLLEKITAVDSAPSLKASIFTEEKAESTLSKALSEVEAEAELLELEVSKLGDVIAPVLRPGPATPEFESNAGESAVARVEDLRMFIMRLRHVVQSLAGRVDL